MIHVCFLKTFKESMNNLIFSNQVPVKNVVRIVIGMVIVFAVTITSVVLYVKKCRKGKIYCLTCK